MYPTVSLRVQHDTSPAYKEETISVYTSVVLDGVARQNLDIAVFFKALGATGRVPLFTCGCGIFECGGFNVEVSATPEAWAWRVPFDRLQKSGGTQPEDRDAPWFGYVSDLRERAIEIREYRLPWGAVQRIARELLDGPHAIRAEHPQAAIVCGTLGDDLAGCIAEFADGLTKLQSRCERRE